MRRRWIPILAATAAIALGPTRGDGHTITREDIRLFETEL